MTEIHAFPEEAQAAKGGAPVVAAAVGVKGVDRIYQSDLSYVDTVSFFDRSLHAAHAANRTSTPTATFWSMQRADTKPVHVAVRNTDPPTIEVIAVAAAAAAVEPVPGSGNDQLPDRSTR